MSSPEEEPYLSLDDIERELRACCVDIDRMNFGTAQTMLNKLQHTLVRMIARDVYEVLPKEVTNG